MDDYSTISLTESKNEWVVRLVNLLTPCIIKGLQELFKDSWELCIENDEGDKYLMTFQNFLGRIPKWNNEIIQKEVDRIKSDSTCQYLEDLITCVHIVQLKALSCMRVGNKQKRVEIDTPSLNSFIHQIYIQVARKVYTNIYLFEMDVLPLEIQKNNRELELIIKECIMNTVRDNVPIEGLLRAYLDETEETEVIEEIKEEIMPVVSKSEVIKEGIEDKSNTTTVVKTDTVAPAAVIRTEPSVVPAAPVIVVPTASAPVIAVPTASAPVIAASAAAPVIAASAAAPVIAAAAAAPVIAAAAAAPVIVVPAASVMAEQSRSAPSSPRLTSVAQPKTLEINRAGGSLGVPSSIRKERENNSLQFSNTDNAIDAEGIQSVISAPKTIQRLEQISHENNERRKLEEEDEDEEDGQENIKIGNNISLNFSEVNDISQQSAIVPPPALNFEILT
jgi:hypothetical protein